MSELSLLGTLGKYRRLAPARDRWDERSAIYHATTNGVTTVCGRGFPNPQKDGSVSDTGWEFLKGENWNDVTCSWCLRKKGE